MHLVPASNCRVKSNELKAREADLRQKAEDKKREVERLRGEVCTLINKMYNCRLYSQTTQTAYLLIQGGLRRPIVDPARHATYLQ